VVVVVVVEVRSHGLMLSRPGAAAGPVYSAAMPAATAPTPTPVLQVQGLCFAYPHEAPLFTDWHADLMPGLTLLEGDMGSGKTTLLHLLGGAWAAARGELWLGGASLRTDAAGYRRQACWFDARDPAFDDLNAAALFATLGQRWPMQGEAHWRRHIAGFDLQAHLGKPMYQLSTGTRRKAGLAAALASGCALTLLDEPAAGLDAASLAYLGQALDDAARRPGHALLVASSQPLPVTPGATLTPG